MSSKKIEQDIELSQFKKLFLSNKPLIDVRAPVEFKLGHLPGAVNLPLLTDDERAAVGTTYKNKGREAAVTLGHQFVSGDVKENLVQAWLAYIAQNPEAVIYCFRGGMRSQFVQSWIRERGPARPLIKGGYKAARNFLISQSERVSQKSSFLVVTGPTGSGKTLLLQEAQNFFTTLDLEALAHHRGSAFGGLSFAQPSQVCFENNLAVSLLKLESKIESTAPASSSILVEDESRMIGRCALPEVFFSHLRQGEIIWLEEDLKTRVENIFQDYVKQTAIGQFTDQYTDQFIDNSSSNENERLTAKEKALSLFAYYRKALLSISKKLGGLRTQEVLLLLDEAERNFVSNHSLTGNREWIEKLLVYYYDPLYLHSLQRRDVKCRFKGSRQEALAFLRAHGAEKSRS